MLGVVLIQLYVDAVDGIFGYFLDGYIWIQHTTHNTTNTSIDGELQVCQKKK